MIGVLEAAYRGIYTPPPSTLLNTFIGGVGASIVTKADLAAKLAVPETNITAFINDGTNIEASISEVYDIPTDCFNGDTSITYFRDKGRVRHFGIRCFRATTNLKVVQSDYVKTLKESCFALSGVKFVDFPTANSVGNFAFNDANSLLQAHFNNCGFIGFSGFSNCDILEYVSIPSVSNLGGSVTANSVFQNSVPVTVVASQSMQTINSGNPDGDLQYVTDNGGTVLYRQNLTAPEDITDLTVTVNGTSITPNFTVPTSTNTILFYNVFLDGEFAGKISAPGESLIGLPEGTHEITVVSIDNSGNQSEPSNAVSVVLELQSLLSNATEVWSLRRVVDSAVYAVDVKRTSDNAITSVELPVSGFISLSSTVTAGGTLGAWVGANDAIVTSVYGQQGFKNLSFAANQYKLIIGGVLQTNDKGNPAILASSGSGIGGQALELNGNVNITDASIFSVVELNNNSALNRPYGFGNSNANGSGKINWNIASDNSFRYDGAALTSSQVAFSGSTEIRSSFKIGDTYKDYINGVLNLDGVVTGTNILDDFYIDPYANSNTSFFWSESSVFLTDETANREAIRNEINNDFGII